MSQLSNEDLKVNVAIGKQLGLRLPAINLHDLPQDYPRRREILMVFEAMDRQSFVRMERQSDNARPMTAEAELARRGELEVTQTIHDELMATDAGYLQQQRESAVQREADILAAMERKTNALARKSMIRQHGSEAAADRAIAQQEAQAKAKAEQAERDRQSAIALEKRIAAKQAETLRQARMAGIAGLGATGVTS